MAQLLGERQQLHTDTGIRQEVIQLRCCPPPPISRWSYIVLLLARINGWPGVLGSLLFAGCLTISRFENLATIIRERVTALKMLSVAKRAPAYTVVMIIVQDVASQ